MDSKFTNRYNSFSSSLSSLEEARHRDENDSFVLSGTIQKFSLTFDISWKVMKDIIVKYHQIQNFATGSPRETLRTAFSVNLISDDKWLQMLRLRNDLAHDYDGSLAKESFHIILDEYLPLFETFQSKAQEYLTEL